MLKDFNSFKDFFLGIRKCSWGMRLLVCLFFFFVISIFHFFLTPKIMLFLFKIKFAIKYFLGNGTKFHAKKRVWKALGITKKSEIKR